jgi:hypothetical protein
MGNVPQKEHNGGGHQKRQSEPVKESPRNHSNSNTTTTPRADPTNDPKQTKPHESDTKSPRKGSDAKNPAPKTAPKPEHKPEPKPEEKPLNDSSPTSPIHHDDSKSDKVDTLPNDSDKANFAKQQFDQVRF